MKGSEKIMFLAIRHNAEGRPCGWGLGGNRSTAVARSNREWLSHTCHFGEARGKLTLYRIVEDPTWPEGEPGPSYRRLRPTDREQDAPSGGH